MATMKKLLFLFIISSFSSSAQVDSLRYFFINSDYKRIIEIANQKNTLEHLKLSDIRYISYAYKSVGDYTNAIRIIKLYEKQHGSTEDLIFLKAEYLYQYGRSNQALKLVEKLLMTDSLNFKYLNLSERIYKAQKQYTKALGIVIQIYKIDSLNPLINYKIAYYNTKLKNYKKAIDHFNKTLILDSTYTDAWRWLGKIYSAKMQHDTALYFINTALDLEPTNLIIVEERANINYRKGHYFRAKNDFQKLIDSKQVKLEIYFKTGVCYLQMRQPQKALEILTDVYSKDSSNYLYAEYLGILYNKLDQKKKAEYYLNKSISLLQPDDLTLASIYRQLANIYFDSSEKTKMDKAIHQFYLHSSDIYLLYNIARKYDKQAKTSLALEYYQRLSRRSNFPKSREFEYVKNRIQILKEDLFFEQK